MTPTRMAMTPTDSNTFLIVPPCLENDLCDSKPRLEQPGNQTPSHVACILGIAFEVFREKALFIQEPPGEHGHNDNNPEQAIPRVKRERYADEQKKRSGIHRMPHHRIRPR